MTCHFCNRLGDGKALPYIADMLQWEKVHGKETSFVGCYYMLSKVFMAADTSYGTFQSSMATMVDKTEEEESGMYLIWLYHGESLQWPFRVTGTRAIPLPIACHDGLDHEDGWWQHHNKCFHILLTVPKNGHVILPSQLTGISGLTQTVFKVEQEYGQCCMLFRIGEPTHVIPLGVTEIRVFGSIVPQSRMGSKSAQVGQGGQKCPLGSSTPKPQTGGGCSESVRTSTNIPSRTVSSAAAAQGSPGIPEDCEVLQPQTRASKKRRLSGGQGADEQLELNAALGHIKGLVMANIRDRIAFNRITEEFCQLEKLHLMEVVAVADGAYTKALKDFPSLVN